MDRRYKKETTVKQTQYIYSNENVLEESITISGVTKVKEYINGLGTDNLIGYEIDSVRYYYVKNHLGSIDGITDNSGNILINYEYDSYGNIFVNSSGSLVDINDFTGSTYDNERLFTGREYDIEINLYYMRARYYDSKIGRFISRDPIDIRDDVNLYSYVGNNPVMFLDLMGLGKVLIIYSPEHYYNPFDTRIISENVINYYLQNGYKRSDIILLYATEGDDFVKYVNKFTSKNTSGEIVYVGHNEGWLSEEMTDEEILKLNSANSGFTMSLLACSTIVDNPKYAKHSNQIAQKLSNQLNINVSGTTEYINFSNNLYSIVEGSWKTVSPGGEIYTKRNLFEKLFNQTY